MPGPNIKDVTEAVCPETKPYKCLPYGTCFGHDTYCNQQHGDVVSCFPLEFRNNVTKILDWCRDVKHGKESPINAACKFACENRFNSSELDIMPDTSSEPATTNCSSIVREVTSCPLPRKGGNQTNIFDWCNGVLQQGNLTACDTNNSVFVTDTPFYGSSSDEAPTWSIAVMVILAILFLVSLILNIYLCKKTKPCDRGSYTLGKAENGELQDGKRGQNDIRDDDPVHRQRETSLNRVVAQEYPLPPVTPGDAGAADAPQRQGRNVTWEVTDEAATNRRSALQIRNSTSEAPEDDQDESAGEGIDSEPQSDTETDPFVRDQEEDEQPESVVNE